MIQLKPEKTVVSKSGETEYTNTYHATTLPEWVHPPEGWVANDDINPTGSAPYWWSGKGEPPKIGDRVFVRVNGFGMGTVRAYLMEYGWLGVEVEVDKRPAWHIEQCGEDRMPMCFGAELGEDKIEEAS